MTVRRSRESYDVLVSDGALVSTAYDGQIIVTPAGLNPNYHQPKMHRTSVRNYLVTNNLTRLRATWEKE